MNIADHMRGEAISVLSLEGRYHCHESAQTPQRTRNIFDIVLCIIMVYIAKNDISDNIRFMSPGYSKALLQLSQNQLASSHGVLAFH